MEYRIIPIGEYPSPTAYVIEVKHVYNKGFLWWRKEVEKWLPANCDGYPYKECSFEKRFLPKCSSFTNLEAAKRAVLRFQAAHVNKHFAAHLL